MREIKFRYWDDGKFFYSHCEGKPIEDFFLDVFINKYFEPEQYINRKDANGKDIFQGDNLQVGNSPVYTVKWQDDGWMMCGTKNGDGFCVKIPKYMEIIGNIHEEEE